MTMKTITAVKILATLVLMSVQSPQVNAGDWLIDPSPYRAAVTTNAAGNEIALENGLVRRVIRLAPNAATIRFDNLMTGEHLVRSVRPEAVVSINGQQYDVGGLIWQPIHNYLEMGWVDAMAVDRSSFQFKGYTIGTTVERFPWKKRREWMPADMPWPAPGKSLTLTFTAPTTVATEMYQGWFRDFVVGYKETTPRKLDANWKLFLNNKYENTSLQNEGKQGEIMAYENTHAFAEIPWMREGYTVGAQVTVDPGTDRSRDWGPGIALVYPGNKVVKLNLRTGEGAFGMSLNGKEGGSGKMHDGKVYQLRLLVQPGRVIGEATMGTEWTKGQVWSRIGAFDIPGTPVAVRVGKMDAVGGSADAAEGKLGDVQRCILRDFRMVSEKTDKPLPPPPVEVDVHYEIYDGLPLVSKWITVRNETTNAVCLDKFTAEVLAVPEPETIELPPSNTTWRLPNLFVGTDYTFNNVAANHSVAVNWTEDPLYKTQVNWYNNTPCQLECRPPVGPNQDVTPKKPFESFRVFELALDSTDRERQALAVRRMYRTMAPWVTENPILMHATSAKPDALKLAIDQCAEVGFEMVVMSFGSGFKIENPDPVYQKQYKELADYARSKGIALGGYSLLASRGAKPKSDNCSTSNGKASKPMYGVMPCLGAQWGVNYLDQIKSAISNMGLGIFEHDGSYPGDMCDATNHPYHKGFEDSQWVMWKGITGLYQWCRSEGVYLHIPDWYFLNGATKTMMGYRETNCSLPRAYQEIIERQGVFDGTWDKTPSMGWMFVPLTVYQGGGKAATVEPLKEHLPHYGQRFANLFGAGVQAVWRGPRLYDAPETEALVKKWVGFYKRHRAILDSDIIHLRRADGQDLDYILHVNPALKEKGLLMVYNPLEQPVSKTLTIPLYYTGLTDVAQISEQEGKARKVELDRAYNVKIPVTVPANACTWFVVEAVGK